MIIEFGVHAVEQLQGGGARIVGRVISGVVSLSTCFVQVLEIIHLSPEVVPHRIPVADISLAVTKIECYGREIYALDEGVTGRLTVSGIGVEHVKPLMNVRSK